MADKANDIPGVSTIFEFIKSSPDDTEARSVTKDLYDKYSRSYEKETQQLFYSGATKTASIFTDYFPDKNISILDCGAGSGLVGVQLNALGYKNVVGLDISPKILEEAEQKGVYKKVICAAVGEERMPFENNEFDVLVCCGCIAPGHISPTCFPEWVRVVKPGGYIVLVLRRCYVELQKDLEEFYSQRLGESFEANIRDLEESNKWKVTSRAVFPGYLIEKGLASDGIAMVFKVL